MKIKLTLAFMVLSAVALIAQSTDPSTQLLLDHLKMDRDISGAGAPGQLTLEDWVKRTGKPVSLASNEGGWVDPEYDPSVSGTNKAAEMFLSRMFKENDIAVVATVERQISTLNTSKTKIVTDSLLTVNDVLHERHGIDVHPGDKVVVARSGGRIHIDDQLVQVSIVGFAPFITGKEYLLFLHRNQQSGSYQVSRDAAFFIEQNNITPLLTSPTHPARSYLTDKGSFFNKIRGKSAEVGQ